MANLITEKQLKVVNQEYAIRLVTTGLAMIAVLGVFFLSYVAPYYVIVSQQEQVVSKQFDEMIKLEERETKGQSISKMISQANDLMAILSANLKQPSRLDLINKVIDLKSSKIHLNRFNFISTRDGSRLVLNGVSDNRDALVDFISALKSSNRFESVESPISDFAKNLDIPFTVNLKIP